MAKLRKQVSLDFLEQTKQYINELLATNIPQSAKYKLCVIVEKMLSDTKSYNGYKHLYWSKYGCLDWEEAKKKKVFTSVPDEYIYGPDDTGDMNFCSDIQGKFSRKYN
jgi:hypothetical protein